MTEMAKSWFLWFTGKSEALSEGVNVGPVPGHTKLLLGFWVDVSLIF